ncbi:DUF1657 domain-containing protein [Selenihalanaerobacter shriftii]|uniref:DUF1657 domain-containing protein n=1 Tax=Selenihalanaerobacter shriftii TaxID=142842 RepID=A0A1T4JRC8_9FIRM|nr:DUF1657 domain-containing protein [Selenihalanaerobacter shriftii]SJZ32617.1 Protein of unknown function [Selenihalanaerobacter shriftii]
MTVGQNLHQSLTALESEKANMESYALQTQDQMAQQMFNNCANQLDQVVQDLKNRTNYVEGEEPQFKVKQQQNQQQS